MGTLSLNWDAIEDAGPECLYLAQEMRDQGRTVEAILAALMEVREGATPETILNRLEAEGQGVATAETAADPWSLPVDGRDAIRQMIRLVRSKGVTDPEEIAAIVETVLRSMAEED